MKWGLLVLVILIVGVWCVYFASSIVADDKLVVAIITTLSCRISWLSCNIK